MCFYLNKMWFCHSYDCVILNAHSLSILGQTMMQNDSVTAGQVLDRIMGAMARDRGLQLIIIIINFFVHTQSLSFALYSLCLLLSISALICA